MISKRIEYFEFIKNIPYRIGLDRGDPDYCCSSKSVMLANLLEGLGLQTRQIICTFDWTETPVPSEILSMPREAGETHQYMQVYIPEQECWVDCDCTWDSELAKGGFSIAQWDGLTNTKLAVKPHKIYTPEETLELKKQFSDPVLLDKHLDHCRDFYTALNKWLQTLRSN